MADVPFNDRRFRHHQRSSITTSPYSDGVAHPFNEDLSDKVHCAVKRTKTKITNLKQEVEAKDREIRRERAMRKAAEKQEQDKTSEGSYVDPYAGSTPSVNEELKQWLSPAAQRKRLLGRGNSPPQQRGTKATRGKERRRSPTPGDEDDGQEHLTESYYYTSEEERKPEKRRDRREEAGRRHGRQRKRAGYDNSDRDDRPGTYPGSRHQPPAWYGDYGPPLHHPAYAAHNLWISPHRVPPIPSYDPRLMHTIGPEFATQAYAQHTSSTPQHPRRHSVGDAQLPFTGPTLVIPTQNTESGQGDGSREQGGANPKHASPQQQPTSQRIPVTIQIQPSPESVQQSTTRTNHQGSPSLSVSTAARDQGLDTSHHSEMVNIGVGASPPPIPSQHHGFDERGLPLLLDELGATKDKNKALAERCSEAEREIESLQLQLGVKDAMSEAEIAAKGAALIEEIYTAQREHDEAIMGRLRLANDERDDAFARLHKYQQSKDGFDSGTDVNSNEEDNSPADATLGNLLSRLTVANDKSSIDRFGSAIVGRISKTKGRRQQITSEEMRAILKEKDMAVAKCKKLEREVIELRKNCESSKSRNNNEKALKAQLDITREERDKALVAAKKLKGEIDSLKMYYSLHKSLSQEASLRDQFNNTLGTIEDQVKARDEVLAQTQLNNSQLAAQVRGANEERNKMAAQLQVKEQENQQLRRKHEQLERLVMVLRKKIAEGTVKTV
ncbi:uncharacterized protein [Diadema antillarum]|uniref:uncharacterized protein n=1 Tax=Diadema antillarum TaxID=105358 RepID=UPI003A8768CF